MKKILINSYAKINLSLDVTGCREDGYHEIVTVMQQVALHDEVCVRWLTAEEVNSKKQEKLAKREQRRLLGKDLAEQEDSFQSPETGENPNPNEEKDIAIELSTNRRYLPTDSRNLAYKAAELMAANFGEGRQGGRLYIDIKKRIPVSAGLAGGSGNGAAVLHALNKLWGLSLTVAELCKLGESLGSDVPFCIMGQARANSNLGNKINKDPLACTCAIGRGTGTDLVPVPPLRSYVVLTRPPVRVSTAEVYGGIDEEITKAKKAGIDLPRPNAEELTKGIKQKNYRKVKLNMINLLECYTLKRYPIVLTTKDVLQRKSMPLKVLMSGSGPTVFAVYSSKAKAKIGFLALKPENKETYLTKTLD